MAGVLPGVVAWRDTLPTPVKSGLFRADDAGFGDEVMDALIVGLDGDVVDDLKIEGDGDALGAALRMSEEAVVVAAATTETRAIAGEGEAGDEDEVERGDADARAAGQWLPDVHLATLDVVHAGDEAGMEFVGYDFKEACTVALRDESGKEVREEVRLVFEAAEEGEGDASRMRFEVMQEMRGDLSAGSGNEAGIESTQALAHVLAKRGFVVHAGGSLFAADGMQTSCLALQKLGILEEFGDALEKTAGAAAVENAVVEAEG